LHRVLSETPRGATVQERITGHFLREFRAEQRDQWLTAALLRMLTDIRPEYAQAIAEIQLLHMQAVEHVATAGGPVDEELRRRLRMVSDVCGATTGRWQAGILSAADTRFEIRLGCYLVATEWPARTDAPRCLKEGKTDTDCCAATL
jgi:hypothetical protein